jgi:hypothetical protein
MSALGSLDRDGACSPYRGFHYALEIDHLFQRDGSRLRSSAAAPLTSDFLVTDFEETFALKVSRILFTNRTSDAKKLHRAVIPDFQQNRPFADIVATARVR